MFLRVSRLARFLPASYILPCSTLMSSRHHCAVCSHLGSSPSQFCSPGVAGGSFRPSDRLSVTCPVHTSSCIKALIHSGCRSVHCSFAASASSIDRAPDCNYVNIHGSILSSTLSCKPRLSPCSFCNWNCRSLFTSPSESSCSTIGFVNSLCNSHTFVALSETRSSKERYIMSDQPYAELTHSFPWKS